MNFLISPKSHVFSELYSECFRSEAEKLIEFCATTSILTLAGVTKTLINSKS